LIFKIEGYLPLIINIFKKQGQMEQKIDVFKALGDENRLRILCMLSERNLCVCEINAVLNVSMSTISSHLKILRNAGLVTSVKDGRWIIYSLNRKDSEITDIVKKSVAYIIEEDQVAADLELLKNISPDNCTTA